MRLPKNLMILCAAFLSMGSTSAQTYDFGRYSVPVWQGRRVEPVFRGPSDPNYQFRTVLRQGFRSGRLVAGHYALIAVGCGMECVVYQFGDITNGNIITFPLGGEYYPSLELTTTPDSRLIIAKWGSVIESTCSTRAFVLIGNHFSPLGSIEKHKQIDCRNY